MINEIKIAQKYKLVLLVIGVLLVIVIGRFYTNNVYEKYFDEYSITKCVTLEKSVTASKIGYVIKYMYKVNNDHLVGYVSSDGNEIDAPKGYYYVAYSKKNPLYHVFVPIKYSSSKELPKLSKKEIIHYLEITTKASVVKK